MQDEFENANAVARGLESARDPETWAALSEIAIRYGLNIIAVVAILIIGFWIAGMVDRAVNKVGAANARLDKTLFKFLGSLARYAVLAFTFLMVLERFGVQTTSIVAIIGAAGLAVGLALQGTLTNLAAGVMLLLFRPFNVGDLIDGGGWVGKVTSMGLFTTELTTPDAQHVIAPNSSLWGAKLINHSHYDVRGVDMRFKVAIDQDIDLVRMTVMRALDGNQWVLKEPRPFLEIETVGDGAMEWLVRPFCKGAHYFDVRYSVPEQLKRAFDAAGVSAPIPHRVIINK